MGAIIIEDSEVASEAGGSPIAPTGLAPRYRPGAGTLVLPPTDRAVRIRRSRGRRAWRPAGLPLLDGSMHRVRRPSFDLLAETITGCHGAPGTRMGRFRGPAHHLFM